MADLSAPFNLAYFFVPLPEPLALPDRYTLEITHQESFEDVLARTQRERERNEESDFQPETLLSASFRFWRAQETSREHDVIAQLFDVARKCLPDIPPVEGERGQPLMVHRTIVEMVVPLPIDDEGDALSVAFDEGITLLREFQRAYYIVTKQPLTLVSRQRLPPVIPVGIRRRSEADDQWPRELHLMLLNINVTPLSGEPNLSPEALEQLQFALAMQPGERVFASYADLARDARKSLDMEGDHRAAVLFTAVAAEVFLDDLLAHMIWEEAIRPEDAAQIFDSGLQTRVRNHYHIRLGGSGWGLDKPGVPLNWQNHIASIRHRVVHGGYEPTSQEAAHALDTLTSLTSFVTGRLVTEKVLRRYPRTALSLLGKSEMQRRQVWSKRLQQLSTDASEPHWQSTFIRWKATMHRSRSEPPPGTPEPTVDSAATVVVVHPDGSQIWVLHHRESHMARRIAPPRMLSPTQAAGLARLVAEKPKASGPTSIVMLDSTKGEALTKYGWLPEYHLIPMVGVMVNGADLDPPTPL